MIKPSTVDEFKDNKTVMTKIWQLYLTWLTADLMDRFMGKPCGL